jgi:hypothetical protein
VTSLLAAFGAGAVLVLAGGAFAPDLMRLPEPPAALASPWSRTPDDAAASRGGADVHADPSVPPSAAPGATSDGTTDGDTVDTGDGGRGGRDADRPDDARDAGGGSGDTGAGDDDPGVQDDADGATEDEAGAPADDGRGGADEDGRGGADEDGRGATDDPTGPGAEDSGAAADTGEQPATDAAAVLALVDAERAAAGCPALRADTALDGLGAAHAADMRDRGYFDHTDPDGRTPWDRAAAAGVDGVAAENIARGQADATAVVAAWMDSPGHRANILDCSLTRHGLGRADGSGGPWWVQVFGR